MCMRIAISSHSTASIFIFECHSLISRHLSDVIINPLQEGSDSVNTHSFSVCLCEQLSYLITLSLRHPKKCPLLLCDSVQGERGKVATCECMRMSKQERWLALCSAPVGPSDRMTCSAQQHSWALCLCPIYSLGHQAPALWKPHHGTMWVTWAPEVYHHTHLQHSEQQGPRTQSWHHLDHYEAQILYADSVIKMQPKTKSCGKIPLCTITQLRFLIFLIMLLAVTTKTTNKSTYSRLNSCFKWYPQNISVYENEKQQCHRF